MVTVDTSATSVEALPKHRSTLGRQSIDMLIACRSRVDRVTFDISTDASVDVSVEVRYKIHDPTSSQAGTHPTLKYDFVPVKLPGLLRNGPLKPP